MICSNMTHIIFVAGWNSNEQEYKDELTILRQCYPNASMERFRWNSDGDWGNALTNSNNEAAQQLRKVLNALSPSEMRQTVVIGHSLGARIAVNAVCNISGILGGLVLMGAAINHDSPTVERASANVSNQIVNLYSPSDLVLMFYRFTEGTGAFGQQAIIGNYTMDIQVKTTPASKMLETVFRLDHLLPFLIPNVGVYKLLTTVSKLASIADTLKSYILQSHCLYEYAHAWLDNSPNDGHTIVGSDAFQTLVDAQNREVMFNAITWWYESVMPEYKNGLANDIRSMLLTRRIPSAQLAKIKRVTLSIHQITPDLFDWNCIIDTVNTEGNSIQVSLNLDINRDRDFTSQEIREKFVMNNCQYLDCIVYEKQQ